MKIKQLSLIFSLISVFSSSLVLSSAFEKECMPEFSSLEELQAYYEKTKEIVADIKNYENIDLKTAIASKNLTLAEIRLGFIDLKFEPANNKCFAHRVSFGLLNTQEDCIKSKELYEKYNKALDEYYLAQNDYSYAQEQFRKTMNQKLSKINLCIKQRRYDAL